MRKPYLVYGWWSRREDALVRGTRANTRAYVHLSSQGHVIEGMATEMSGQRGVDEEQ